MVCARAVGECDFLFMVFVGAGQRREPPSGSDPATSAQKQGSEAVS